MPVHNPNLVNPERDRGDKGLRPATAEWVTPVPEYALPSIEPTIHSETTDLDAERLPIYQRGDITQRAKIIKLRRRRLQRG